MKKYLIPFFLLLCVTSFAQQATLVETKAWLEEKLNSAKWGDVYYKWDDVRSSVQTRIQFGDELKVKFHISGKNRSGINEYEYSHEYSINANQISLDIAKEKDYGVVFLFFHSIKEEGFTTTDFMENESGRISTMEIIVDTEEEADRLIKAFKNLIKLSGGKEEKF